jgi:hypothetical protein
MAMQRPWHNLAKRLASLTPLHRRQDGRHLHMLQRHWGVSGVIQYITPQIGEIAS